MVEWDGLENRCTGHRTEGSNPSLSANHDSLDSLDYLIGLMAIDRGIRRAGVRNRSEARAKVHEGWCA